MKRLSVVLAAFLTLLSLFAVSAPAEANGRFHGGVFLNFGVPWPGYWGPRYYYPPAYYYYDDYYYAPPAVVLTRPNPPQYIERSDVEATPAATPQPAPAQPPAQSQPQQPQHQWWYWCQASEKYFPYVKECPGGFQRVPAQPTPSANR
jgi:hypothetical protein